eukprot:TRINITY_DN551_c1_g1_i3.p1 TRINITY_DN551_c1_g1~~TRINITY_DN551_c1_g1_i3.p1  ORF type:complete len:101 (-),score=7.88 TRINITY_DN551_c1_g1_i3:106-408(-)
MNTCIKLIVAGCCVYILNKTIPCYNKMFDVLTKIDLNKNGRRIIPQGAWGPLSFDVIVTDYWLFNCAWLNTRYINTFHTVEESSQLLAIGILGKCVSTYE